MTGKRAIHFGAGNIGRGFIGPLLVQAGYHVIFADIDGKIIEKINELGEYSVHFLGPKRQRPMTVSEISGVISTSEGLIKDIALKDVKLITTSVGLTALPRIAGAIAKGISQRRLQAGGALNVIACENGVDATNRLRDAVFENLSREDQQYAMQNIGFANCTVDRIVPPFDNNTPLDVGVEDVYGVFRSL
jgi:mannitol-1-phosphate/altronate dehydrogenase